MVNVVHAYDPYDFAYDGTFALLHTHHKPIMYSKPPETSTDAHQEKLDLVKHSDDAHEAPPPGSRLDEGLRDMDGKLVELVIADLESRLDDEM